MKYKSNWDYYGVKIIKQIVVEGEPDPALLDEFYEDDDKQMFEEAVMLIHAQSFDHAYKVAKKKVEEAEKPYPNKYGQQVTWKLVDIVDCFLILNKLASGTEVYSCFHTTQDNAKDFMNKWFNQTDNA